MSMSLRRVFPCLLGILSLAACGKGDEREGPDLRTPPPVPKAGDPKAGGPAGAPPTPAAPAVDVKVATPVKKTVPVVVDYTGQTTGSETVEVRARVEGFLQKIHFVEGTFVKEGDLLYEIDPETANQIVEQAQGELNVAKANAEKASQDVARYKPLVEKNAISREEYETALSAEKAAMSKVDAAAAAVERAKINLGYTKVKAPMAGLVGKTEVDVGNLVGRGEPTLLTTISKIDPIFVEVRVSETDVLRYQRARRERGGQAAVQDITLSFSDKTVHPHKGKVAVVDRNVDLKTGTLLVMLEFPNPEQTVRPGQFARVEGVRDLIADALLVPQTAVEEIQGGYRLFLVGEGDAVRVQAVKVGPRQGNLWMIEEGLKAEDRVIVEGRQKVREGARVRPIPMTIGEDGTVSPQAPAPGASEGGTPAGDGAK